MVKILPEFPVRVGDVPSKNSNKNVSSTNSNRSFKIDYFVVCEEDTVLLVELKTDVNSLKATQNDYLTAAKDLNIQKLLSGVKAIFEASAFKKKYMNYLQEMADLGWLKIEGENVSNISKDYATVRIVYIQPVKKGTEQYEIITFDEIIEILNQHGDFLTKRFLKSLEKWKRNPNQEDP